jgi:hypothetical protein
MRVSSKASSGSQSGSILLVTVFLAGILGLGLGYYLWLVRAQNLLVARSQAWNSALSLAEAGVEEGLAQANVSFGTNYLSSAQANWGSSSPGVYGPRSNSLDIGSYSVVLIATNPGPTLIASGYVASPLLTNSQFITRTVQVTTTANPAFRYALGAGQGISLNGNNVSIDSFDSSDPTYSTSQMYDPKKRKAGADIAATTGFNNSGTVQINGTLRTGPGAPLNLGTGGFVGDLNFTGPGIECVQDYSSDFNQQFRPVLSLNTVSFTPPLNGRGTNRYILNGGNFIVNGDLSLDSDDVVTVVGGGNSVLFVAGNVSMSGPQGTQPGSSINIAPGCNLLLYVAGSSATLNQVNTAGPASSFQYYGLPSNTSISWTGNSEFVGGIYAPQAQLSLGSGSGFHRHPQYQFQGACIVNSVTLNGRFFFHYDEALKHTLSPIGFVVTSWREL